jgi:hypothetical protein
MAIRLLPSWAQSEIGQTRHGLARLKTSRCASIPSLASGVAHASERVEHIVAGVAEECACGQRGQETQMIGYEQTKVREVRPAEHCVTVLKREERACRQREGQGVHTIAVT